MEEKMKKKTKAQKRAERVCFKQIKRNGGFRLSIGGPIYIKSDCQDGQRISGAFIGCVTNYVDNDKRVYPVNVKIIVEEK